MRLLQVPSCSVSRSVREQWWRARGGIADGASTVVGASSTVNAFLAHAGSLPSVKEIALTVSLACLAALVLLTGTGSSALAPALLAQHGYSRC